MKEIKTGIKFCLNKIDEFIQWNLALACCKFIKKEESNSILLVPADDLIGGFGDDVMITSFIANFAKGRPVSIFTRNKIVRNDYLSTFNNVSYLSGFKDRKYIYFAKNIKKHSLVYVLGADIMDGTYGYYGSIDRIRLLRLANIIGIKSEISGFSVSDKMLSTVKKEFIKVSKHTLIKARDIDSYNRLKSFLLPDRLLLTNDIAFICPDITKTYETGSYSEYINWCNKAKENSQMIIGFCSNSIQANKIGLDNYLNAMSNLIISFLEIKNMAIVFLYHDIRPLCGEETDKTISEMLYKHFLSKNVNVYFPEDISNGVSLKGYLHTVDFSLTGRMHLGISGITFGKPMFGVCYANKFEGMVRLFDIEPEYCLAEYTNLSNANKIVESFMSNFEDIKVKTEKNKIIKEVTLDNFITQ